MVVSKRQGYVAMYLCEVPYLTILTTIIHKVESHEVTCPKTFIYCKPGVSELKLEHSAMLFDLYSYV